MNSLGRLQACFLATLIVHCADSQRTRCAGEQTQRSVYLDKCFAPEDVVGQHVSALTPQDACLSGSDSQLHDVILLQTAYVVAGRDLAVTTINASHSRARETGHLFHNTLQHAKFNFQHRAQAARHLRDHSSLVVVARCYVDASHRVLLETIPVVDVLLQTIPGVEAQDQAAGGLRSSMSGGVTPAAMGLSFLLLSFVVWHEVAVYRGGEPLLARWALRRLRPLQAVFCSAQAEIFKEAMIFVTISYDLALELGRGVTTSGFILSVGTLTFPIGAGLAKRAIGDGSNWQQQSFRRKMLNLFLAMAVCNLSVGFFSTAAFPNTDSKFWFLLANRAIWGFMNGNLFLTLQVMTTRTVPPSERTVYGLAVTSSRNIGMLAGPVVASLAMTLSHKTEAPATEQVMSIVGLDSVFSMINLCLLAVLVPAELQQVEDVEESSSVRQEKEMGPEDLPDDVRRRMMYLLGFYNIERMFTTQAIEVSSVLIFEVEYGMNSTESGFLLSLAGVVSACVCALFSVLLVRGVFQESTIIGIAAASSFFGSFFLFDVGGVPTMIMADMLLYSFCSLAGGATEGWATRACKEGTDFNQGAYRAFTASGISAARLLCPPVARSLVGGGGRNLYAAAQFIFIGSGCYTVAEALLLRREYSSRHRLSFEHGIAGNEKTHCPETAKVKRAP